MASRNEEAIAHLMSRQKAANAVAITIRRGNLSGTTTAVLGGGLLRVTEPGSGIQRIVRPDLDLLIERTDYVINGQVVRPEDGDLYDVTRHGETRRYKLLPNLGEPAWRFTDSTDQVYRLHAKGLGVV